MMNDPPFDDDELINDFNEEEDFYPAEYDFDIDEYAETENQGQQANNVVNDTNAPLIKPTADVGKDTDVHDVDMNMVENMDFIQEDPRHYGGGDREVQDVPMQVAVTTTKQRVEKDLYGFEWYNGGRQWRQNNSESERGESDVMEAAKWKQKIAFKHAQIEEMNMTGGSTGKNWSQEAQLVRFSTRGQNARPTSKSGRFLVSDDFPAINQSSFPVTVSGKMVHVPRTQKDLRYMRTISSTNPDVVNSNSLLGINMSELTRRADALARKHERKKKQKVSHDNIEESEVTEESDRSIPNGVRKALCDPGRDKLWVDKHAPSHFSDLLSDEKINREVLRALRQWDPYVFQKKAPLRPAIFQNKSEEEVVKKGATDNANETEDKRPDEKNRVILLSGPPGVGKTTLAHIVCKHAGYRPLEVNASDERSASVLTERVMRVMESSTLSLKSLNGKDDKMRGRPNCLILDEIDGADAKSSIVELVKMIRAEKMTEANSKKKDRCKYLRRPIIFICNHKHAPVLRPLLPYARQFDVSPPSSHRLVARLKAVLSLESMSLVGGSTMLSKLVEGAGGDIRSCLYTLQFVSARAREMYAKKKMKAVSNESFSRIVDITPALSSALVGSSHGLKDERTDMSETLVTIFRKLKNKKRTKSATDKGDIERILTAVDCFGDNSKTLDSLFMNIMNVSYIDPTLDRCWTAHEWLSSVDIYRSSKTSVAFNNSSEHHAMQKCHIPSAAAAIHLLCRVETRPDLSFSLRPLLDVFYQLEANNGLVDKFLEGLPPSSRSGAHKNHFVADILPYCLWLLSAGSGRGSLTRPVSSMDILTKEEKEAFRAHVDVLRSLGLTYVKEGEEDEMTQDNSVMNMRLEPEIDKISRFQDMKSSRGIVPPLLKELLAHATTVATLKASDSERSSSKDPPSGETISSEKLETTQPENLAKDPEKAGMEVDEVQPKIDSNAKNTTKKKRNPTGNFLGIGAAKAKAARNARKAAKVGFSKTANKEKMSNIGTGVPLNQVLRFKYQKGFTQAVRLPCSENDLMLE